MTEAQGLRPQPPRTASFAPLFLRAVYNRLFGPDVFISYSIRDESWAEAIQKLMHLGRLRVFRDATGIHAGGLGDDRRLSMDYFAAALQATRGGNKIVYHESHDEAGNGKFTDRTIRVAVNGAPLVGETRRHAEARCRFAAGVTLLSAGVPMFLFGEEVGVEKKFLYDHVLDNREDLEALRYGSGRSLFEFYRQLIRLRLAHPGFRSPDIDVVFVHNQHRLLVFRRWGDGEEFLVVASLNNTAFDRPSYVFRGERISGGRWREIFNSDSQAFGGSNVGNFGAEITTSPGSLECVVPANGLVVFERTE